MRTALEGSYDFLTRWLMILKPLLFIPAVIWSLDHPQESFGMWMWALGINFMMIVVGLDIGLHRHDSHVAFKTTTLGRIFLLFWGLPTLVGSPLHWSVVHRKHHAECETDEDPHSPHQDKWWHVFLFLPPAYRFDVQANKKYFRGLIGDPIYRITHLYYYPIVALYVAVLWWVGWEWLLFCMLVPAAIVNVQFACLNVVCHMWGYKNYPLTRGGHVCEARNNWFIHLVTFFSFGMHNNHHWDPGNHRCSVKESEFDFAAWIIETFFLTEVGEGATLGKEREW
ncbi:fatty acid desaturase [bacterium]|nr:fatty acid desaturase [bacterium]